ncbi:MAG: type II toxin-antitoxin system death-on-curing family toxin [Candidatus Daviesbacteria bacterium]|nr:type II toxin-antitoxin system death-on-curing family toxin [Candidatus Daviesbacteria bacterium]
MSWQTVDILEVIEIHQAIIQRAKTKGSVRDFSLLHSAVERPNASFQGQDLYPTIFLKASALLQSLCLNHPFTDGNKRTAWMATKRFLAINGYHLKADRKAAADFMVWVDNGKPELSKISSWLRRYSKAFESSNG